MALFRKIAASAPTLLLCLAGYWAIGFIKPVRADQTGAPPISNNLGDPATAAELGVDTRSTSGAACRPIRSRSAQEPCRPASSLTASSGKILHADFRRRWAAPIPSQADDACSARLLPHRQTLGALPSAVAHMPSETKRLPTGFSGCIVAIGHGLCQSTQLRKRVAIGPDGGNPRAHRANTCRRRHCDPVCRVQ